MGAMYPGRDWPQRANTTTGLLNGNGLLFDDSDFNEIRGCAVQRRAYSCNHIEICSLRFLRHQAKYLFPRQKDTIFRQ
ncbi:hypothetical protein AL755_03130 (plasmid) [Arthrobacter sp. ERGS1:01]|nr:hypothetical protein AL755_03130 [Arthrobacter sp. ERGS1:01]